MNPRIINSMWRGISRFQGRRFHQATRDLARSQERHLLRLVRAHADTDFGRAHGFSSVDCVEAFRRVVPLTEYADYAPYINCIRAGESKVLTTDPVLRFEPTSGTRSAPKLIPYTHGLRREVSCAVAPWVADLFQTYPALRDGAMYWAISPRIQVPEEGAVPVGFDSDTGYFGGIAARLAAAVLPVPASVGAIHDLDEFRDATLRHLLAQKDLRLISVWNPTFLEWLLAPVKGDYETIWPHLAVISCWTDGWAAEAVPRIEAMFPQATVQPKGLLATEAVVTIPVGVDATPVLAAASHFFEFMDVETGELRLAHQVEDGVCYEVVVTTGGGLYRYRMHDQVTPEGRFGQAPILQFLGRDEQVSDLRGEKLHESFVAEVLSELAAMDAYLRPVCEEGRAHYELLARSVVEPERLDQLLRQNIHYNYCRELGQLDAPTVRLLESDAIPSGPLSTSKPRFLRV